MSTLEINNMLSRSLRFFGALPEHGDVILSVTVNGQLIFDNHIVQGHDNFLFEVNDIAMDFTGSVPMEVLISRGTLTMSTVMINYNRIPNPIYNDHTLRRFQSAMTWSEKISIMRDLADPGFSQDQIDFLLLDDPAQWIQQEEILDHHGCGLTVLDPAAWREVNLDDEPRTTVTINGILQIPQRGVDEIGAWHWPLTAGDVMCCDLMIAKTPTIHGMNKEFLGAYTLPKMIMDFLAEQIPLNELKRYDLKILDIGTGTGEMLRELRTHGIHCECHGLDTPNKISPYVLSNEYNQFIEADLRYPLPIQDNTYDIIICSNVFLASVMQLENDPALTEECLDEILRILKPQGIFVFSACRSSKAAFDRKLNNFTNISVLAYSWGYHRDKIYMFPPTRLCIAVRKLK